MREDRILVGFNVGMTFLPHWPIACCAAAHSGQSAKSLAFDAKHLLSKKPQPETDHQVLRTARACLDEL
jgi:hypothetical protein